MKRLRMYLTLTLALLCLGNGAWPPSGRAAAVDSPAPARPVGSVSLPLKGAPARTVQPGLSGAGSQTRQSQVAKLTANDGAAGDYFGWWVSVSGDTAFITAPYADVGANADQGAVYVYHNEGWPDVWNHVLKLTSGDGKAGDMFGYSVSLSGDTAVVGATLADVGHNVDQGAAYVLYRNQGGPDAWGQVAKLTASDGAAGNAFGAYPSLSGDTAVIGAFFADVGGNVGQGAAYVFYRDLGGPGTWGQAAKLTSADGAAGDEFGGWVSFSGAVVMITACLADVGGNVDQGAAYVFALPSLHLFKLKASTRPAAKPGWNKVIVQGIVHDGDGNAFSGATAAGTWTLPDGSIVPGAALGPTDARGRFKFRLKEPQCGLFQFDVTGISATAYTYDPMSSEFSPHIEITVPCP